MIEHFYESIPGWFNFQDIYRDAVARARDGAVFVEVGSWLGRSTAFMAVEIANSGKAITFYAVDTWEGSPAEQYQSVIREHGGSARVYQTFFKNMLLGGVANVICPLIGKSHQVPLVFDDRSLDFVFLDAAHDFHSVRDDVRAWLPKVKVGGMLAGHDANCPGLMNAVREYISHDQIVYTGTSWCYTVPEVDPLDATVANAEAAGLVATGATVRHVGVWDDSLASMGAVDYARRMSLAEITTMPPPSLWLDAAPYIAKWGGRPGEETFDFPYGVTTLDW